MEMPSATKSFRLSLVHFRAKRYRPGALSHMVSANLRARALAPIIREIWAAGYMSYNAVSRELNRRQVPTLRGEEMVPDDCGATADASGTDRLIRIRRQSACSLLELVRGKAGALRGDATDRQMLSRRSGLQALLLEYSYGSDCGSFVRGRGGQGQRRPHSACGRRRGPLPTSRKMPQARTPAPCLALAQTANSKTRRRPGCGTGPSEETCLGNTQSEAAATKRT